MSPIYFDTKSGTPMHFAHHILDHFMLLPQSVEFVTIPWRNTSTFPKIVLQQIFFVL